MKSKSSKMSRNLLEKLQHKLANSYYTEPCCPPQRNLCCDSPSKDKELLKKINILFFIFYVYDHVLTRGLTGPDEIFDLASAVHTKKAAVRRLRDILIHSADQSKHVNVDLKSLTSNEEMKKSGVALLSSIGNL